MKRSNGSFAIRQGDWKLCLCPDSGGWSVPKPGSEEAKSLPDNQLYNMKNDIRETVNLHEHNALRIEQMEDSLRKIVEQGRSTPGKPQNNNGKVNVRRNANR